MNKICVYTCITGNYDNVNEFKNLKEKNIDYYLFTNNKKIKSDFWNVVYIEDDSLDNIKLARKTKILGNEIVNKYDVSVWMDGLIVPKVKISEFIKECDLKKYDLIGFKHQLRDCVYDECKAVVREKKEKKENALKIEKFLEKENYPKHNGLIESTILVRNLKSETLRKTCELWFDMICNYSIRDQLSFNYSAHKNNLKFKLLDMYVFENKYFTSNKHVISNNISKYRLYFGNNDDEFDYNKDIQGNYKIKDNKYIIETKCPCDTNSIYYEICDRGMFSLSIKTNKKVRYNYINGFNKFNNVYFFNYGPKLIIEGDFKKNDSIKIEIEINILSEEEIFNVVNTLNHENNLLVVDNNSLRSEIEELRKGVVYRAYSHFKNKKRKN